MPIDSGGSKVTRDFHRRPSHSRCHRGAGGWLLYEHGIEPHVTVFDKSARTDGTFSREDFTYDHAGDVYRCPGGKVLTTTGTLVNDGATMLYVSTKRDCDRCALKSRCCPKQASRKVPRSIYEGARDMARQIARSWEGHTSRRLRKKIEMLFAHLKAHSQARPFTVTRPKWRA